MPEGISNVIDFMKEPIPSFFFEVVFMDSEEGILSFAKEMLKSVINSAVGDNNAFAEVQGLTVSYKTGTIKEAGWSSPRPVFEAVDNDELTLVRYLRPCHITGAINPVTQWCQETMERVKTWEKRVEKKDIMIFIYHPMIKSPISLGPASAPVAGFKLQEAFPVSWGVSDLSSTAGDAPLKETIKFKYTEIQRISIPSPF